jgi:phosphatidylserine/phosphatidylglycerophosphate/cardiolipin synthase-like enzyme
LKDNLLEPLGEHRTNVKIRTYSRYKEHEYISTDEDTNYMEEFGIHGKLQTIGDSETGAVLLGSANFMENSFDWNPECGIYTENPLVTDSAITFFDFVWELAQADPVSFDQMKEVPDREFYPSYYQR